jgi:WD40 repeat protein
MMLPPVATGAVTHEDCSPSTAFTPDGRFVVAASVGKIAGIGDAATGRDTRVPSGREYDVTSAAVVPDGKCIVTASWDKTARICDVHVATMPTSDLMVEVCSRRRRVMSGLNREERRRFGYPDAQPEIDLREAVH